TQEDNGIDVIITYKEKLILIQCKNMEMPITVQIVRMFESALSRFSSDSLGLIVYNSEKLNEKFATPKAKHWAYTSKKNIKICNEKEFVDIIKSFFEYDDDNDQIELFDYKADTFDIIKSLGTNVSIVDFLIEDRTIRDIKIFNTNVDNELEKKYIENLVDDEISKDKVKIDKVAFIKPKFTTTVNRKIKRARSGETCDKKYLKHIYTEYESRVSEIYPDHIVFDNVFLCE
ncbi:778_t:CDS:2, partial [Racocetra fulgida]